MLKEASPSMKRMKLLKARSFSEKKKKESWEQKLHVELSY